MSKKNPKIIVTADFSKLSEREFFSGFLKYAHAHPEWDIQVIQTPAGTTPPILTRLKQNEIDGIITTGLINPRLLCAFRKLAIPIVIVGSRESPGLKRLPNLSQIKMKDEKIGSFGARFLANLGTFRTFAYVPTGAKNLRHMDELRLRGFNLELSSLRLPHTCFKPTAGDLGSWIASLPRPAAILCGNDQTAVRILKACNLSGPNLSTSFSILGIDNDELCCLSTAPALSSIMIHPENEGCQAGKEMERRLRRKSSCRQSRVIVVEPDLTVIERKSTMPIAPAVHLIRTAEQYIADNVRHPIRVTDVINHLRVSRRLAELRFRQYKNASILETIKKARLDEFARRLVESNFSIRSITTACGFSNACYLKTIFRKQFKMSPREYRQRHLNVSPCRASARPRA